jgi:hypothetical protein
MSALLPVTVWTIAASCLTGLLLALLGSMKLAIARRPGHVTAPLSLLLILFNVALLPLLVLGGVLIDVWGLQPMMIVGPVLLSLSLLALSFRPDFRYSLVAVLLAALAAASVATTATVLMPRALFGESERATSFLLGMVFVALGALASAPLLDLLRRWLGFRGTMGALALAGLLPAILAALLPEAARSHLTVIERPGGLLSLLEQEQVWWGALVLFFYSPLEGFVSVWVAKYLEHLGESPKRAANLLMGFWGAMIASRFGLALLLHYLAHRLRLLGGEGLNDQVLGFAAAIVSPLLVAVILGNLAGGSKVGQLRVGLILLGAFMGPIYPLVVGLVFLKSSVPVPDEVFTQTANPGTVYALLCVGGSLGGLMLSPVIGYCARSQRRPIALLIPMFVALLLTAVAITFWLSQGRSPAE